MTMTIGRKPAVPPPAARRDSGGGGAGAGKTRSQRKNVRLGRETETASPSPLAAALLDAGDWMRHAAGRRRRDELRRVAADITGNYRIAACGCMRRIASREDAAARGSGRRDWQTVDLQYSPSATVASVNDLHFCESVWTCPCCAAKISMQRSKELVYTLKNYRKDGGYVMMVTLTMPHDKSDSLADVRQALKKSKRLLTSGKNSLKNLTGYEHYVAATECNYNNINGWHLHQHILLFFAKPANFGVLKPDEYWQKLQDSLTTDIRHRWCAILEKIGRPTSRPDVACDVRGGADAGKYVSKGGWGLAEELTATHVKRGTESKKYKTYTPRQLLEAAALGKKWAIAAYAEYAKSIKGVRMLVRSRSLTNYLRTIGIDDFTDAQILASKPADLVDIIKMYGWQWEELCRHRRNFELLEYVEEQAQLVNFDIDSVFYVPSDVDDLRTKVRQKLNDLMEEIEKTCPERKNQKVRHLAARVNMYAARVADHDITYNYTAKIARDFVDYYGAKLRYAEFADLQNLADLARALESWRRAVADAAQFGLMSSAAKSSV